MEKSNKKLIEELEYEISELKEKVERIENTLYNVITTLNQRGIW